MKITDDKFLTFLHVQDAVILQSRDDECVKALHRVKREFEALFAPELAQAREGVAPRQTRALERVKEELYAAKQKHPQFAVGFAEGICVMVEEIGELAEVLNDMQTLDRPDKIAGAREAAQIEAAHVAVTAVRFMEMLDK